MERARVIQSVAVERAAPAGLPPGEELAPADQGDVVRQMFMVLQKRDALAQRQAKYEDELRRLHATGDQLREETETLGAEYQACVQALLAAEIPSPDLVEQCWRLFKAQVLGLLADKPRSMLDSGASTIAKIRDMMAPTPGR